MLRPRPMRTLLLATLAGMMCVAASSANASAAASSLECQHPVTTGVEVSYLKHITGPAACKVALALHSSGAFVVNCVGANNQTPKLMMKTWHGWKLSLVHGLTLTRARSSFAVSGTDFPAPCA